mmetsp:Transcript_20321/g.70333  ORF Transcript_20321/g.70333 Transcript_20321/m.70333 type:complete len:208 (-) Transcript_20321:886-1509(-)
MSRCSAEAPPAILPWGPALLSDRFWALPWLPSPLASEPPPPVPPPPRLTSEPPPPAPPPPRLTSAIVSNAPINSARSPFHEIVANKSFSTSMLLTSNRSLFKRFRRATKLFKKRISVVEPCFKIFCMKSIALQTETMLEVNKALLLREDSRRLVTKACNSSSSACWRASMAAFTCASKPSRPRRATSTCCSKSRTVSKMVLCRFCSL